MATSKRTPAKKEGAKKAPAKRAPRKRAVKPVPTNEAVKSKWAKMLAWVKARWILLALGAVALIVIAYLIFKEPSADKTVETGKKREQKLEKQQQEIDTALLQNEIEKAVKDALQEQAVSEANEATADRKQYEVQSAKKKEQTKLKYNETNKDIQDAATNYNLDKLDAILKREQRARKEVSDGERVRTIDTGFGGRYKGN